MAECVDESLFEQTAAIDEKNKAMQFEHIGYRADNPDADRIGTEILRNNPPDATKPPSRYGSEVFFATMPLPAAADGSVGA